jgi:type I restriction enzyme S subunit
MKIDKSKWEYKKLGEVCFHKDVIQRAKDLIHNDDIISYIDISSVDNVNNKITGTTDFIFSKAPSRAQQIVEHGDILYSLVRPNLKKIAKVDLHQKNIVASSGFCIIRSSIVNNQYLFYLLLSNQFTSYILQHIAGANYPATRGRDVMDYKFALPPNNIQQQIVSELDKLNALIAMKQQQLKEFDTLAQAIFYQMFGDPANNEKGWKRKKFSDLFALKSGAGLSAKEQIEGRYPVYGGNGINGYHNIYNKNGKYIIIGRVGAYCGNVRLVNGCFWLTDNAFELIEKQDAQDKVFLKTLLTIMNLGKFAHKAAQPVISNVVLQNILFPLPPLPLQQTFAHKIEAIERQKTLVKSCIADLQELLAGKMDEYFG